MSRIIPPIEPKIPLRDCQLCDFACSHGTCCLRPTCARCDAEEA